MESRASLFRVSGSAGSALLLGLSRWTILHPIVTKVNSSGTALIAKLHLAVLEAMSEMPPKSMTISNKSLVLLLGRVDETLKQYNACDLGSGKELCLDRLGQFLHCSTACGFVQGKLTEVVSATKKIHQGNRILEMYVSKYQ